MSKQYFLVRNFITGEYLDFEYDDYYTTFGEIAGATVFDDKLYSDLTDELKKDTQKVYIHLVDDYAKRRIADLEAKLAQAQKTIEIQRMSNDALIDENLDYRYDITDNAYELAKEMSESWKEDYEQELVELKQQLAEKEKEYKSFKKIADENVNYFKNRILEETRSYNQDKISFAVEQLEKVKWDEREKGKRCYNIDWKMKRCFYSDIDYYLGKNIDKKVYNVVEPIFSFDKYGKVKLTNQHEDKGEQI